MSELSNNAKNQDQQESSSIKTRFASVVFVLVWMGIATLMMQRLLNINAGVSRVFGVLTAVCLGFFGYKWTYEQMLSKQEHREKTTKLEVPSSPAVAKTSEKKDYVPQPKVQTPESTNKHSPKQMPRKNSSPNNKANIIVSPQVFYSEGVPKDVGFGRGDQQQQQTTGVWLSAKIYIPEVEGYSFIGRILGPRGISVRRLEAETECKILIRGRGSIKDEKREQSLVNRNGWAHLNDKLHVLLLANDESEKQCRERLENAVQVIQRLLIPQYDEYKRQQLVHLAILNGTYRP